MKKNFEINSNIYSQENLEQAIGDFSEMGEIILDKNNIEISGDSDVEIEEIFNELMNYVLAL